MSEQPAIAVVGGGIAGLAFALALHQRGIGHVALDQLDTRMVHGQIFWFARGQIVQHAHRITLSQQGIGQMGADEAGPSGDQYMH